MKVDPFEVMGRVGLPAPVAELAAREWDAVVVGAGHNGLTAAAYLARAGLSVLVLERREQIGGACTLERPFADQRFVVSPCAYVVGLLDRTVIGELELARHGYRATPADPGLWCPFADGTSFADFSDPDASATHLRANGFSEADIRGLAAYEELFERARLRLRNGPAGDTWAGPSPTRERIEQILGEQELIDLVFSDSIADVIARYMDDPRLHAALAGQGIIGTWAGPRDPGTASIHLMHHQGDVFGTGPAWGYVDGGMGAVSFALARAAAEAGAAIAAGTPVAAILPGEGIELESGELIRSRTVVCNADPKRALALLGEHAPAAFADRLGAWDVRSGAVKLNLALECFPRFTAAADGFDPARAMITITPGLDAMQDAFAACERGEPAIGFCELYCQSAYDPSVAPPGMHTLSAFCHYAPYEPAAGTWDELRDEVADAIIAAIAVHAPELPELVLERELLAPPDIEERIGLSGGHIFQGSALPGQMWDRRLDHRTPVPGLYLCGAATHPGGSVIALNGRSAAAAAIEDLR